MQTEELASGFGGSSAGLSGQRRGVLMDISAMVDVLLLEVGGRFCILRLASMSDMIEFIEFQVCFTLTDADLHV